MVKYCGLVQIYKPRQIFKSVSWLGLILQYNVSCSFSAHIKEVQQMECENGGSCWTSVWLASFVQIPQKRISRYPSRLHTFHEYWFAEKRGMLENISAVLIFYNKILFTYIWCFSCVRILRGGTRLTQRLNIFAFTVIYCLVFGFVSLNSIQTKPNSKQSPHPKRLGQEYIPRFWINVTQ